MKEGNDILTKKININIMNGDSETIYTKFLALVAIGIPGIELLAVMSGNNHIFMAPLLRIIGVVGVIILSSFIFKKKKHSICVSDLFLLMVLLFSIISIIFSKSKLITFTGAAENHSEDPLQVMGYLVIFFMATNVVQYHNKKKIMVAILIACVLHTIPAILQHLQLWPFEVMEQAQYNPAFGLTLHYNYYGALSVLFSAITTMVFLIKKTTRAYLWYIAAIICFTAAMFSGCRLAWVGIATYLIFVVFVELYTRIKGMDSIISIKRYVLIIVSFGVACVLLILFDDIVVSQVIETTNELEVGNVANMGTGRMNMWLLGLESIKDYPLTGVGFDNFVHCYKLHPEYNMGWIGYKAHNEYLQIFVTQGVLSGVCYICMCIYTVLFAIKTYAVVDTKAKEKAIIYILMVMIVGYFCQAFFNNSATNISPYKWLIMGLLLTRCKQKMFVLRNDE